MAKFVGWIVSRAAVAILLVAAVSYVVGFGFGMGWSTAQMLMG